MVRQLRRVFGVPARPAGLFVILTVFSAFSMVSTQAAWGQGSPPSSHGDPEGYVISPGDVLDVAVWGYEDLSATVRVREDGKISFTSLIEEVSAAGLTVPALQEILTEKLSYYLKDPRVTISVRESRLIRVNVIGSVRSPGTFTFRETPRVIDVIAAAGGETPEADVTCITIARRVGLAPASSVVSGSGGEPSGAGGGPVSGGVLTGAPAGVPTSSGAAPQNYVTVDLHAVLAGTADPSSYALYDGDTVFVPKALAVKVMGMVRAPGTYFLERGARLMDAIARAGDILPQGDPGKVSVSSGRATRTVSITGAMLAPDGDDNVLLKDRDIIHVPEAVRTISVLGEVDKPGIYPIGPDPRVFDVIAAAGGPGVNGDITCIQVTRGAGQATQVFEVDLGKSGKEADRGGPAASAGGAFKLEPGDVVYVPKAIEVQVLGQVRSPGTYRLRAGSRLVDAMARAGGPSEAADTSRVSLTRAPGRGADGSMSAGAAGSGVSVFDLDAILKGVRPEDNVVLQDHDIISIPELIQEVSVLGEVARPGTYRIRKETRVLDVLALAGGVTPEGDATSAVLTSKGPDGEARRVLDLDRLQAAAGGDDNILVKNGDVLYVPRAISVMVLGKVKAPGTYTLPTSARFMDAMSRAGGVTNDGDPTAATLTRQGETTPVETVDIRSIMAGADDRNIHLHDGDIIFVPELVREVSVLGQVAKPGVYQIREGATLLEALAMAGGVTETADDSAIRLTTRASDGTTGVFEVDIDRLDRSIVLRNGDVIFVPEIVRQVSVLGEVARPGVYRVREGTSLLEVLAMAGGITQMGDDCAIMVTTRGVGSSPRTFEFDLRRPTETGDASAWLLQGGEVVYVPRSIAVHVVGEVAKPGLYYLKAGSCVADAVALAGGLTGDADGSSVTLTTHAGSAGASSGGEVRICLLDVNKILTGADSTANRILSDQDTIFVPKAQREVVVVGEVAKPGVYKIREGARLMDAIALAGGPTKRAALEAVCVFRNGQVAAGDHVVLGRDNLFFTGKADDNPAVVGGDIVYVPATSKIEWEKVFSFLSGLKLIKDLLAR
ncbi:MAG: SLBB domain-containing protein [Bacillota bacterium]|nr:SLBB domain-containing protein [Bacillota bacterium]